MISRLLPGGDLAAEVSHKSEPFHVLECRVEAAVIVFRNTHTGCGDARERGTGKDTRAGCE